MIFGVVAAAVPEGIKAFSDSLFVDPFFFLDPRDVNHQNSDIELPVPEGVFLGPFAASAHRRNQDGGGSRKLKFHPKNAVEHVLGQWLFGSAVPTQMNITEFA
jgi:hypothetical protein